MMCRWITGKRLRVCYLLATHLMIEANWRQRRGSDWLKPSNIIRLIEIQSQSNQKVRQLTPNRHTMWLTSRAELLEAVKTSLRAKVAALAEDNWMFEPEEQPRG